MYKLLTDPLPWGPVLHTRAGNDRPPCDPHQGKVLDYRSPRSGKSVPELLSVQNSNATAWSILEVRRSAGDGVHLHLRRFRVGLRCHRKDHAPMTASLRPVAVHKGRKFGRTD